MVSKDGHILISGPYEYITLHGKETAGMIKLRLWAIRLFWINQVGPILSQASLEGIDKRGRIREGDVITEAEVTVMKWLALNVEGDHKWRNAGSL